MTSRRSRRNAALRPLRLTASRSDTSPVVCATVEERDFCSSLARQSAGEVSLGAERRAAEGAQKAADAGVTSG